jgi:WD40 repeat protein
MRRRRPDLPFPRIGVLIGLLLFGGIACGLLGTDDLVLTGTPKSSTSPAPITAQPTNETLVLTQSSSTQTSPPIISPQVTNASDFVWLPKGNEVLLSTANDIQALSLSLSLAPSDLVPSSGYIPTENPSLLSVAQDKAIVAWVGNEDVISVWQAAPNAQVDNLDESDSPVTGLALSYPGDQLAYSALDHNVVTWDIITDRELNTWKAPSWLVNLTYSPDSRLLAGTDLANFSVYIFNSSTGIVERTLQWSEDVSPALYGVYFSPDWRYMAWVARNSVQIMYVLNGELGHQFVHEDFVNAVAWSPDSHLIATASAGTVNGAFVPVIIIWDVESGDPVATLGQPAPVVSLSFSPDGSQLGILDSSGQFRTWIVQ